MSFNWVQTIPDVPLFSGAGTPDGGVLGAGVSFSAFVTRPGPDGAGGRRSLPAAGRPPRRRSCRGARASRWPAAAAARPTSDPGADIDIVFGDIVYLSRYAF